MPKIVECARRIVVPVRAVAVTPMIPRVVKTWSSRLACVALTPPVVKWLGTILALCMRTSVGLVAENAAKLMIRQGVNITKSNSVFGTLWVLQNVVRMSGQRSV